MSRQIVTFIIICICANTAIAQPSRAADNLLVNGIYVRGGVGYLAIRDEYISEERYSGALPSFELSWLRADSSSAYRLGIGYIGSSTISNNNVSAQVMQTGLNFDFLYSVGRFRLLDRDVFLYAGPSADIYLYYRQQNIATGGNAFFNAYSFALFFSLSANSTVVAPLSSDLAIEASGRIALLSFAGRLADVHDNNASFVKPLTILSGLRGYTEFLLRYDFSEPLLVKAGYRFEICQSASWNYLLSASDNVIVVLAVRL